MKVVIQGGGFAGLATAARLSRIESVSSITVLERDSSSTFVSGHTGLWTNALNVLRSIVGDSALSELTHPRHCGVVQDSGYRDSKGSWLMKPNIGVSVYDGKSPSLCFMRNQSILEKLQESVKRIELINIKHNSSVESIKYDTSIGKNVIGTSGEELVCDLLVAADGFQSPLVEYVNKYIAKDEDFICRTEDRGYYVYRGYLSKRSIASIPADELASSYQSWGAGGLRFAVVPASGGGVSWFAAVSQPVQANMKINSVKADRVISGPFANSSWIASVDDLINLRSAFSDWHPPIPALVEQSLRILMDDQKQEYRSSKSSSSSAKRDRNKDTLMDRGMERVSICRAISSEGVPPRGFNKIFVTRCDNEKAVESHGKLAFASVGDAFFTFDPILAVGGGQGLVAAELLSSCLRNHPNNIEKALEDYGTMYSKRAQVLSVISDIAQSLGSVRSPVLRAYVDVTLSWLLPGAAKGRAMDSLIRVTAGLHQ